MLLDDIKEAICFGCKQKLFEGEMDEDRYYHPMIQAAFFDEAEGPDKMVVKIFCTDKCMLDYARKRKKPKKKDWMDESVNEDMVCDQCGKKGIKKYKGVFADRRVFCNEHCMIPYFKQRKHLPRIKKVDGESVVVIDERYLEDRLYFTKFLYVLHKIYEGDTDQFHKDFLRFFNSSKMREKYQDISPYQAFLDHKVDEMTDAMITHHLLLEISNGKPFMFAHDDDVFKFRA